MKRERRERWVSVGCRLNDQDILMASLLPGSTPGCEGAAEVPRAANEGEGREGTQD
jgi:hypothetical protein